jgi:hypothetical protein
MYLTEKNQQSKNMGKYKILPISLLFSFLKILNQITAQTIKELLLVNNDLLIAHQEIRLQEVVDTKRR